MNIIKDLTARGFIDQVSSPDLEKLVTKPIKAYIGFDPTADSLHVGNLVGIMALVWMQKYGHTPYVILGGGTGRIGDPSGKSRERPLLDEKLLQANVLALEKFFKGIFPKTDKTVPVILNNDSWLQRMSFIHFLRDVGKEFRLGVMLAKESVKARLESEEGMSFTEFCYQILQAYDFAYLADKEGVVLQMGGSDQWGNIIAGIEFARKKMGKALYGATFPLLTRSDGKKFGKSEEGAIWLSKEKLSPYDFYQYFVRLPDGDVIKMMRMLTFMSLEEIAHYEKKMGENPNFAQKKLAEEVTRFVHEKGGLQMALKVTQGAAPGAKGVLTSRVLEEMAEGMPSFSCKKSEVIDVKFVEISYKSGLVPSKSEAVRLIKNGGAYLNNEKIEDPLFRLEERHLIDGKYAVISAGKKKKILLNIKNDL